MLFIRCLIPDYACLRTGSHLAEITPGSPGYHVPTSSTTPITKYWWASHTRRQRATTNYIQLHTIPTLTLIHYTHSHTMPAISTSQCYAKADRFRGRTVVITGAGSGFGRATAVEFAKHGAKLVLGDVDEKGMRETCSIIERAHGR